MSMYYIWFTVALILVLIELNIMSFYLIAVAVGLIAGGITSLFDTSIELQILITAIVTIIASIFCKQLRHKFKNKQDLTLNNPDIGQRIEVTIDSIKTDGTARVMYRGTQWDAFVKDEMIKAGVYSIINTVNNKLELKLIALSDSHIDSSIKEQTSQVEQETENNQVLDEKEDKTEAQESLKQVKD